MPADNGSTGSAQNRWPVLKVNGRGHLLIGGRDAVELAREFGTPLYVFDEDVIRERCRQFREALGDAGRVVYAGKAFLTVAMARIIDEEGLGLDVVSGGELYTALAAGFPPERIVFHGNNKGLDELSYALREGVGRIVIDNEQELRLLGRLSREIERRQGVMLRVSPGIEAHTHEYISTGQQDSKFGFDIANGQALEAARAVAREEGLVPVGLHCHIGSQVFETEPFKLAVIRLMELAAAVYRDAGWLAAEIDIGGGFGIRYTNRDNPPDVGLVIKEAVTALRESAARLGLPVPTLVIEPGRAIIGEAGCTLYTVGAVKRIPGIRTYVAVDGGMADNPRPALYGAEYTAVVANRPLAAPVEVVRLVGRYCESGDILIKELPVPEVRPGDVICVFSTGAYHYSMSSNYNRFPRPAAVLVRGEDADIILERETYADLIRNDRMPARLLPSCGLRSSGRKRRS